MNMNAQVSTEQSKSTLIGRLADRLIASQYQMAVKSLQMEAPDALEQIVAQADPALDSSVAAEIERLLRTGGAPFVRFEKTLMPQMQARFGVTEEQMGALEARELSAMKKRCNSCSEAARCWQALRGGESAEQCREFCPNAGLFRKFKARL